MCMTFWGVMQHGLAPLPGCGFMDDGCPGGVASLNHRLQDAKPSASWGDVLGPRPSPAAAGRGEGMKGAPGDGRGPRSGRFPVPFQVVGRVPSRGVMNAIPP